MRDALLPRLHGLGWLLAGAFFALNAGKLHGCIWDSDTLFEERWKDPKLADVVLANDPPNPEPIRARIRLLSNNPRKGDPAWWNDLAGAHLRLGEAGTAATLLEPLLALFPDDYGIHANLGTAYHLLGEYAKAEKHIARDLLINPDAHFGLEKYHLALLQYLVRDAAYQMAHVYVDEFSEGFVRRAGIRLSSGDTGLLESLEPAVSDPEAATDLQAWLKAPGDLAALRGVLDRLTASQAPPAYRLRWNLATEPKLEEGVLYMATLNRAEPAALTMLGIVCLKKRDLNLAAAAFDRAIALKSPQAPLLQEQADAIRRHIVEARWNNAPAIILPGLLALAIVLYIASVVWRLRRRRPTLR